jgi:hypothetical protein
MRRRRWIASLTYRRQTTQFEFTISQIDAIGYWMPVQHIPVADGMIVRGGKIWRPGLRFEDFESGVLDLSRLKTGRSAQFDVAEYPLFQLALSAVPESERSGPYVTDTDGDPVRYRVFYGMYREIADAAAVPKEVWNARARHGGGTEARASGASIRTRPTICRNRTWRVPGAITSPGTSRRPGVWRESALPQGPPQRGRHNCLRT